MNAEPLTVEVDHVLAVTGDAACARRVLRQRYGLDTVTGPDAYSGIGMFIVPLAPPQSLRVLFARDFDLAVGTPWGRWLCGLPGDSFILVGWAVRTRGVVSASRRLGIPVQQQALVFDRAHVETWRTVADHRSFASMPHLVQFDHGQTGRRSAWAGLYRRAHHDVPAEGFTGVRISAGSEDLDAWIDNPALRAAITTEPGIPCLRAVTIGVAGAAGIDIIGDPPEGISQ